MWFYVEGVGGVVKFIIWLVGKGGICGLQLCFYVCFKVGGWCFVQLIGLKGRGEGGIGYVELFCIKIEIDFDLVRFNCFNMEVFCKSCFFGFYCSFLDICEGVCGGGKVQGVDFRYLVGDCLGFLDLIVWVVQFEGDGIVCWEFFQCIFEYEIKVN